MKTNNKIETFFNIDDPSINPYYCSYYHYAYGRYRVYKVFKRYESGRSCICNMTSYNYDKWKYILKNPKYANFGLKEIQIIKPKIYNIEPTY